MMRADTAEASELGELDTSYSYDAFLSYAHEDRPVAYGVQRSLHHIGRRLGQLRALRVFRDSTDLTASPDLWSKVTEAMDRSRYFIAVLSPYAAASHWVNKEVTYWLEHRGADQLMLVTASGQLLWDAEASRFDPDRSDAALPVLTQPGALKSEPFYVDVSGDAPWHPSATLFREKVTDLAAPIHGKPKSELAGEDLREQRRFRRLRRAAVFGLIVLTVIAVVAAVIAVVQRGQAIHQRNEAIAGQLVSEAASMLAGVREGNDARAINQILAARNIAERPDEGPTLSALQATVDQLKIIETAEGRGELAVSADGSRIMSTGSRTGAFKDSEVTFRDAETGGVTATFPAFAFSADGTRVLSQSDDDHLQVHDTQTGQPVGPAIEVSEVGSAHTFSPDSRRVVFGQGSSTLSSWDIARGTVIRMTGFSDGVSAIVFMPDGRGMVTSGGDGAIRVWDAETGFQLSQPISMANSAASNLAVSPDGRSLVTEGELSNGIRIWDLESGQLIADGKQHEPQFGNYVNSVAISRDGRRIVTASNDRTIQLWDAETAAPIGGPLSGHRDTVDVVTFSANGEQVISRSTDNTIRVWNANPTGTLGRPLSGVVSANVAITRDARRIVWYSDAAINVWDMQTLEPVLPPLIGEADDFALSHDGSQIAALSATTITIWDATTGARLREWDTNQQFAPVFANIIFSPDGQKVATYGLAVNNFGEDDETSDTSLAVWDVQSGMQIGTRVDERTTGAGITSAAFSPDSRRLVHNKGFRATVVDVSSGRTVKGPFDELSAEYVAYRPDGAQILAVGPNRSGSTMARTINLIDPQSGQIVAEMNDSTGITAPTFSADGKYIISGHDNAIRVWDAENHTAIGDITGGTSQADVIAISDDNSLIVSNNLSIDRGGDTFKEPGIWPGPAAWPDLLCDKLAENMSDEDWSEWIGTEIPYTPACPDLPKAAAR
jgi:WD40 repeat protein